MGTILLVKSKFLTVQNSKTAVFSRVFTQNNSTIFLGKSKLNFWTKNEDFEQCVYRAFAFFVHLSQYPKVLFCPKIQLDENTRKIVVTLTLFWIKIGMV